MESDDHRNGSHFQFRMELYALLVVKSLDRTYELVYTIIKLNVTIQMHLNSLSPPLACANDILLMSIVSKGRFQTHPHCNMLPQLHLPTLPANSSRKQ